MGKRAPLQGPRWRGSSGLRHVEPLDGLGEVQFIRDGDEALELSEVTQEHECLVSVISPVGQIRLGLAGLAASDPNTTRKTAA
jgi:hypothetical protein